MFQSQPSFNSVLKEATLRFGVFMLIIISITLLASLFLWGKYEIISNETFDCWQFVKTRKDKYYQKYPDKFYDIMSNKNHLLSYSFNCVIKFVENHTAFSFSFW